jgi:Galactose-1-phosphate uridyl transferase, N-terminal domain
MKNLSQCPGYGILRYLRIEALLGASNPHPHGQIWATQHLPTLPALELGQLTEYRASHVSCLLCDYLQLERDLGERVLFTNQSPETAGALLKQIEPQHSESVR